MSVIGKKSGIRLQLLDKNTNKTKSFTIYSIDFDKLYCRLRFYVEMIVKYKKIKLLCYKEDDENE